jgi:class 3 adenylate cyclase/tetratricopeptide (TPR) repeat protein
VPVCATCGHEAAEAFRFCPECGAPAVAVASAREQRKTVTVLFCDVTGSTALGESTDPEALRALLARYFERMKGILESHGGSVEKFIGDGVMAVFGVPQVHEDDALRACRAAVEMRDALPELGVQARIGVNTGEVVTGTEERLATGDAVNVAARLEQAAQPGEILIGSETLALVRDAVESEEVEPLELKGKAEAVPALRLLTATGEPSRSHTASMVGRETELQRLRTAYQQAVHDHSCQLFTVLGTAGVGKSRLAYEFLDGLESRVVGGRCVPYGEGITYWPVVEVVRQLDGLPSDPAAAASLRSLLGESDEGTSAEEIAWGFRKLLEEHAQATPLVCVFDDIHWGEATFLDLIEHVADLSRDAPLLLLCMARPELLDIRPSWGGGKLNATTVLLEPLSAPETELLLTELGGADEALRAKILQGAEGNPLFVEEMLALVHKAGSAEVEVPPTIQALLAARLDQLDPSERGVLECGSVEGRVFHRGAVQALDPDEPHVRQCLVSLVRKELVRPDKAQLRGDDAFRFRHLLIRDAAYDGLPKAMRAELHERFAAWLERHGEDLVELDEILGHHLEQASRYKNELGRPDPELAERAGERLAAAGRRALWRGDRPAAAHLLERALASSRPFRFQVERELDLAKSYVAIDPRRSTEIAEAAASEARAVGDVRGEALALVAAGYSTLMYSPDVQGVESRSRAALNVLKPDDHVGLAIVWDALGAVANFRGHMEEWARAGERALHHSRAAGQRYSSLFGVASALVHGPRPADEALQVLDSVLRPTPHPSVILFRARLLAMLERFDEGSSLAEDAAARLTEMEPDATDGDEGLALIAVYQADYDEAVRRQERVVAGLERVGLLSFLSTEAPRLGRWLCRLRRYQEAERLAQRGRDLGDEHDNATQTLWRQAQALVHAHRGECAQAEHLAREAVDLADRTDVLDGQGDALCDLAEVLAAAGRTNEAAAALEQALARYERKKNLAMVAQVRPKLEELRARVP